MIGQVQTKDGQKIVEPISGSIPTGNPVGTLLTTYKKLQPRNYLYCDGSTFNASQYPALYLYLGTNVLPDYRECVMVGAEQNTTDQIETHDVYTQGEFKDDQIQNITGKISTTSTDSNTQFLTDAGSSTIESQGALSAGDFRNNNSMSNTSTAGSYPHSINFDASGSARTGDVTHGKRKAVYVYIKAVDGVDIADEDTFLDTVKNFVDERVTRAESYSTTETLTGGKWIDGKPIYRKCWSGLSVGVSSGSWQNLNLTGLPSIDNLISGVAIRSATGDKYVYNFISFRWYNSILYYKSTNAESAITDIIIEYTKTTD